MDRAADVVVIGAGPVGCVAALAFARRGAEVVLLEAHPAAAGRRLAGEWLHPRGVQVLERLGVALSGRGDLPRGRGLVVFPGDGSAPIALDYPAGTGSLCCAHGELVAALREEAAASPGVRLVAPARATAVRAGEVRYEAAGRPGERSVRAGLVVGADGRASLARRAVGGAGGDRFCSAMAGVVLEGVELPFEGYGHVALGGPGPVLLFPIAPGRVRVCLDVPLAPGASRPPARLLGERYAPALPPSLRAPFARALAGGPVAWNANRRAPRVRYGRAGVALVGDAVGHFHPLTAAGMTVGFLDAEALAAAPGLGAYRRARRRDSYVPEVLARVFYDLLMRDDRGSRALLQGMYTLWRRSAAERERAVELLAGGTLDPRVFNAAYLSAAGEAVRALAGGRATWRERLRLPGDLVGLGRWLRWPVACAWRGVAP